MKYDLWQSEKFADWLRGLALIFYDGRLNVLELDGFIPPSSDDPFVKAGALLQSVTGFVDARVQAELNWYSRERGYPLSYLTGNHLMWSLKKTYIERHGAGLETDRQFHRSILREGNVPLALLHELFESRSER